MLFSLPDRLSFNSDQEELTLMQAVSRIGQNFTKALEGAFQNDGYSLQSVLDLDVLHPIDGYNLIKRTARTLIKVNDALQAFHKNSMATDEETFLRQLQIAVEKFPSWEQNRCTIPNIIISRAINIAVQDAKAMLKAP